MVVSARRESGERLVPWWITQTQLWRPNSFKSGSRRVASRTWAFSNVPATRFPLFLGGADDASNLEVIDIEVYREITGQLRQGTRKLPPGTTVQSISIS